MELAAGAKDIIAHIAQKHGATRAYLFGSFARGDAQQNSDIDILVDFESPSVKIVVVELRVT